MSQGFHLAQLNVATLLAPLDDQRLKDFVDGLDHINALADANQALLELKQGNIRGAKVLRVR